MSPAHPLATCAYFALCLALMAASGGVRSGPLEYAVSPGTAAPPEYALAQMSGSGVPALTANAGPDLQPQQGETVKFKGSAAGVVKVKAEARFLWRQTAGPAVVLSGFDTATPSFNVPFVTARTVFAFSLTVALGQSVATDDVNVTVERDSPWGVAPSAALSYNPESWLPSMAGAGVTTVRGFHRTATIDRLPPITNAGMSGVGFLMWSPSATLTLPANDLTGWRAYVTDQVTRYKGRVKHWEVWNEPPNFTADQSPVSYGRVVAAAYEAAKAVDPTVQIGLAAKSNHINFLAESIAAGAADKFDFITLHPYEVAGMLPHGFEGMFMHIVPGVRKMLADKNPTRAQVPVWFTEIGIPASPPAAGGAGPEGQGDLLMKIYTLALAQGVARTYWFDPRDSEGLTMGLTAANGFQRPAWYSLKALATHLGVRPQYTGWIQPGLAYHGFVFSGPQGVVLSAWAPPGETQLMSFANDVTAVNPRTGATRQARTLELGSAPQLLVAPHGSAQAQQWLAQAAANQGKPFPWSGDNSRATEVSLTAGSPPRGLFLAGAPAVTSFNGLPEFNFQGRGGPSFTVDPMFVSYSTTPVTVTVVLRKLGTASAGFNFKYEANVPISAANGNGLVSSSAGWHNVAGTSLYERTWTLPNTRFVGMYGYNFQLDSDGPAHSNFSVHKVTVKKQ